MAPVGYALVTGLLFSGSYVAGKYTTLDLHPLNATLFRYVIATAVLLILLVRYRGQSLRIERRHWLAVGFLALSGIVGYHYFFFASLRHTAVTNTAIINAFCPVLTALLASVFIKERLRPKNYLGVVLAVFGVVVLLSGARLNRLLSLSFNQGDLFMVAAVVCFSAYAVGTRVLIRHYDGYVLTLYAATVGVLWLLIVTPFDTVESEFRAMSVSSIYAVVYMGAAASGLGYLTFNLSINALGVTRTTASVYGTVPIFVAVLAMSFFGEMISAGMAASMVLILAGLALMLADHD
ncbi:MAG: EamA family transporter [Thiotrichales bacterium]|nr:EamA family transporter [Thiotrichales bacterium]